MVLLLKQLATFYTQFALCVFCICVEDSKGRKFHNNNFRFNGIVVSIVANKKILWHDKQATLVDRKFKSEKKMEYNRKGSQMESGRKWEKNRNWKFIYHDARIYFRGTFSWRPVHPACIINFEKLNIRNSASTHTHSYIANKIIVKCSLFIKSNISCLIHTGSGRQLNFIECVSKAFAYMRIFFLLQPMISRRHKCSTWIKIDVEAIDTFFHLKMLPDKQFLLMKLTFDGTVNSKTFTRDEKKLFVIISNSLC